MDADGGGAAGMDALPGDIIVEVLRRLRAHSLARCRCVCTLWRAVVDDRGLLLPHALPPRSFPGFFANVVRAAGGGTKPWRPHWPHPGFLPPPASRFPNDVDRLAFLRPHLPCGGADAAVQDQCNGLLLCFQDYLVGRPVAGFVCNPTTERWARLPPPPTWWPREHDGLFLAFDPTVSLEYEVLLLPVAPPPRRCTSDAGEAPSRQGQVTLGMFMPESFEGRRQQPGYQEKALPLLVFSSAHGGRWTRRLLAPGRCAPVRLYETVMRRRRRTAGAGDPAWVRTWRSAVYHRGSLYAHCAKRVLVVLRCSEGTYDMVNLPADEGDHVSLSGLPVDAIFASADDGVLLRYANVHVFRVKVWALQASADDDGGGGQLEWTLTHDKDLAAHARMLDLLHHAPSNRVPLVTGEEIGGGRGKSVWFSDEDAEEVGNGDDVSDRFSGSRRWNWDDAGLLDIEIGEDELLDDVGAGAPTRFSILGCHPSKEVVFLVAGAFHVVAYHLGGGKVRYLGRIVSLGGGDRVEATFPYRPCIVDALPSYTCPFPSLEAANNNKTHRLDRMSC